MPPEIAALIDKPLLLAAVLGLGAACGIFAERVSETLLKKKRREYWQNRNAKAQRGAWSACNSGKPAPSVVPTAPDPLRDAADQLRLVMAADFKPRALLNKGEARVFAELDKLVIARNPGWQVMAQVSVGEFVGSSDPAAYACINSKRVDLLLEYQGTGHHQGTAAARDAVKKEALRKAGIGYHEVVAGHTTPSELRRLVEKLVPGV
jgi:hypothetical protein